MREHRGLGVEPEWPDFIDGAHITLPLKLAAPGACHLHRWNAEIGCAQLLDKGTFIAF